MRIAQVPSAMGLASRLACAKARTSGVAVRPLLASSGLTTRQLEDTRTRIPVSGQIEFLNRVADAVGDDMLGHQLALDADLRQAGLIYYVFASSATLREVFERGARFAAVVNEGVIHEFIDGRQVGLAMRYSGVLRHADRHQIEFWVTAVVRLCRELTGRRLRPARVRFSHFRGKGYTRLERFIGCPVEFGAAADEILFARDASQFRVIRADPFLNRLLLDVCEQALSARRRGSESFAGRVENLLVPLLPHGKARATTVAAQLGLSPRTFARRLAEEDLTFSRVLSRLRLNLARRYLVQEALSISKVAWLLGYQEVGAFSHAFRRWTGKAPREMARRARRSLPLGPISRRGMPANPE
jgi:AraC-like DNA-binding protein